MKKGYRILTSVFVIGLLILSGGTAMAGWVAGSASTQLTVITNGANSAQIVSTGTTAKPVYVVDAGQTVGNNGIVTFTLTGGATFSSSPAFTATTSHGGVLSLIDSANVPGSTSARFLITSAGGLSVNEGIYFATTGTAINMSAVPSGGSVDFLITIATSNSINMVTNASYKTANSNNAALIAASLFAPTWSLVSATADVKATTGPYTKFENEALSTPALAGTSDLAFVGKAGTANTVPSAPLSKYKMLVTLSGDFTGITKVTCDAYLTGSDSSGSTSGGVVGQFLINAAKTAAYATNNSDTTLSTSLSPRFYIDGTTVQLERSFTVKVETFADGSNYVAGTWLGPVKYFSIARNGVFFTSNSIGQYNTVKISDKSGAVPTGGAKVIVSAYDATGTKLAEAAGNADILLQNNQTIELTGTQLAARFVGTAMKYEVAVTTTSGAVTNVKKTPEGFGSNVWTTNGGTL